MNESTKKPIVWISGLIIIGIIAYVSYLTYQYYTCKSSKGSPCKKSSASSRDASLAITELTADEKASMLALAAKANAGTPLSSEDWSTLNKLVYRYVRNGGVDPIVHNDGKIKCNFWKGKKCE